MATLTYRQKYKIFCEELVQSTTLENALYNAYKRGADAQYTLDRKAFDGALASVGNPEERVLNK